MGGVFGRCRGLDRTDRRSVPEFMRDSRSKNTPILLWHTGRLLSPTSWRTPVSWRESETIRSLRTSLDKFLCPRVSEIKSRNTSIHGSLREQPNKILLGSTKSTFTWVKKVRGDFLSTVVNFSSILGPVNKRSWEEGSSRSSETPDLCPTQEVRKLTDGSIPILLKVCEICHFTSPTGGMGVSRGHNHYDSTIHSF